ncbi:hypothetical protein [Knoellia flava]|uniref:Uncharacterized protein n=1 Tax=Knoellia flava TaxID=913969 RepID=A0A8H9KRT8_9MICO|nr:hypothetical protein [Knoellia flava]GGB89516.1 hypothetical protein GCM10011314_31690 [Knoellia flava]
MALGSVLGARTGAALAGVVLALGAATVVAHSATRPADVPASSVPSDRGVGPDATGPAAFGLCRAWANHEKHNDGADRARGSVAMRNLAEAAGGEDRVAGYCATVRRPSAGAKRGGGSGDSGTQAVPKDKVAKQLGKAGRSGKDHPGKDHPGRSALGKGSKRSGSPSPSTSPSASPSPSSS